MTPTLIGILSKPECSATRTLRTLYSIDSKELYFRPVKPGLTTIRTEGGSELSDQELRQFGVSKEGGIGRQVMLGVVQTAEGLPIHHEVFAGNTAETTTLLPTIEKIIHRFGVKRVVLVADRGLLSIDNLAALEAICIDGQPPEAPHGG